MVLKLVEKGNKRTPEDVSGYTAIVDYKDGSSMTYECRDYGYMKGSILCIYEDSVIEDELSPNVLISVDLIKQVRLERKYRVPKQV